MSACYPEIEKRTSASRSSRSFGSCSCL